MPTDETSAEQIEAHVLHQLLGLTQDQVAEIPPHIRVFIREFLVP